MSSTYRFIDYLGRLEYEGRLGECMMDTNWTDLCKGICDKDLFIAMDRAFKTSRQRKVVTLVMFEKALAEVMREAVAYDDPQYCLDKNPCNWAGRKHPACNACGNCDECGFEHNIPDCVKRALIPGEGSVVEVDETCDEIEEDTAWYQNLFSRMLEKLEDCGAIKIDHEKMKALPDSFSFKPTPKKKAIHVSVNGLIGAGKSTMIDFLVKDLRARGYKVALVAEPVNKWQKIGILEEFYTDPRRWSYTFQTFAFVHRIQENIKTFKENPDADIFIMERDPSTDKIFMQNLYQNKNVTDMEWNAYHEWCNLFEQLMPYLPEYIWYIRPSVEQCMERVKIRARGAETGITEKYQQDLLREHDLLFQNGFVKLGPTKQAKVITLETNEDFKNDIAVQQKICNLFVTSVGLESIPATPNA